MERFGRMKIRYWIGIPFLFAVGYMGGEIIFEALVIGILSGFTDIMMEGGGKPPLGG